MNKYAHVQGTGALPTVTASGEGASPAEPGPPGNYWRSLGQGLFCPLAVATAPGRLSLFARFPAGDLVCRRWESGDWGALASLGVPRARRKGSPTAIPLDWQLGGCAGEGETVLLIGRSPDGELLYRRQAGDLAGDFECLGAPAGMFGEIAIPLGVAGPPALCAAEGDGVHLFAAGYDGQLLHATFRERAWSGFEPLGMATARLAGTDQPVPLPPALAACRCGRECLGVFVRGAAGDLLMKWWDGARWSDWSSLGWPEVPDPLYPAINVPAPLSGPPAACSWGPNRVDVFARGAAGDMLHRRWDGTEWSRFESLGMPVTGDLVVLPFAGSVAACTWGAQRLDVFARALDGCLYHAWFDGRWDHDDPDVSQREKGG
jgi:hypothetical protein